MSVFDTMNNILSLSIEDQKLFMMHEKKLIHLAKNVEPSCTLNLKRCRELVKSGTISISFQHVKTGAARTYITVSL